MKNTYNLRAKVTVTIFTTVEAESLDEAIDISLERNIETHKASDKEQGFKSWVANEFDDEPQDIIDADF